MNTTQKFVGNILFYLLGASQFLVGIQIFQINNYGIQPSIIIVFLIFFQGLFEIKKIKNSYLIFIFAFLLFLTYATLVFNSSDIPIFFHSIFILCLQIGIFLSLNHYQKFNSFLSGYIVMATVSSLLAISQSVPLVLNYIPYFLNNVNFSLVSPEIGRGFGITPEPSILASLLVPIIPAFLFRKTHNVNSTDSDSLNAHPFVIGIIIIGLIVTRSQSVVFLLPFLLLFGIVLSKKVRNRVFFPKNFSVSSILYKILAPILFLFGFVYFLLPLFSSRLDSGDAAGSFQIRSNSILLPLQNSFERPILGNGFGSSKILVESNQQLFDSAGGGLKAGVDSVFARIIYEQGYIYFLILAFGVVIVLRSFRRDYTFFLFFLGTTLCAAFVYGYRDFLIFPFTFSMMLKSSFLLKIRNS